jgi:hypothetical protein
LDAALGLLLLAVYIIGIVGLAALVTWGAIKLFPTKDRPSKSKDDTTPPPSDDGNAAGRLYRKAKRAATG